MHCPLQPLLCRAQGLVKELDDCEHCMQGVHTMAYASVFVNKDFLGHLTKSELSSHDRDCVTCKIYIIFYPLQIKLATPDNLFIYFFKAV